MPLNKLNRKTIKKVSCFDQSGQRRGDSRDISPEATPGVTLEDISRVTSSHAEATPGVTVEDISRITTHKGTAGMVCGYSRHDIFTVRAVQRIRGLCCKY